MIRRIATALLVLPVVIGVLVWGGEAGIACLAALAAAVGAHEYLVLSGAVPRSPETLLLSAWGGVVALSFLCPLSPVPGALLALGLLVYLMAEAVFRDPSRDTLHRVGRVAGAWTLVAFFLGHAVLVRRHGVAPMFFLMLVVMVGDSAAYFVGTALGRTRLAPRVSPNKSVEGAVGGVVVSSAAGFAACLYLKLPHGPAEGLAVAAILNVAAQAGDLAESLLKRAAGVKDSGALFPGHGGMLDRVDSFLPTLPLYAALLALHGGAG